MSLVPLVSKNRRNEEKRNIIVVNFEVLAGIRREVKRKTEERKGREKIRCRFEKFACRWKLYFSGEYICRLVWGARETRENRSGGCGVPY